MMESLEVARVINEAYVPVGTIARPARNQETFAYADSYIERGEAPLSLSLPLSRQVYTADEMRPYFEGLLPEGAARDALVERLAVAEEDYLSLLAVVGLDCIGDVVVRPVGHAPADNAWGGGSYVSLTVEDLERITRDLSSLARSNEASRLSLAGTQGKVGLAHNPTSDLQRGWLLPMGGAASTHILKLSSLTRIAEFEWVCMGAAELCGVRVPHVDVLAAGRSVFCVERFDRQLAVDGDALHVTRLHQEDLAQALGRSSRAKYLEVEDGTYATVAQLLMRRSANPLEDIDQLARIIVFNYLVGNCDNHLKNLSVLHGSSSLRLAPAYDIVCTTFFERFSRDMGVRIGSTRAIDEVGADDFALLSRDLGLGAKRMRRICRELSERIEDALLAAGEQHADRMEALPYAAEDIVQDAVPRRSVVAQFAAGGSARL